MHIFTQYILIKYCRAIGSIGVLFCLYGCSTNSTWLNSDRIERAFGSYGVDVLRADSRRRISSLFSSDQGSKTTRTYAVVDFAGEPESLYMREHAIIANGGSIGATFRDAGWQIDKQHLFIGELDAPESYSEIGELMQLELPEMLATHVYLLNVRKDDRTFQYATITEIHHPDYLSADELRQIYGEIIFDDSNRDALHDFIGPPYTANDMQVRIHPFY